MPLPPPRRWDIVIRSLITSGYSQNDIARACNVTRQRIARILARRIDDPPHALGEALLQLQRDAKQNTDTREHESATTS